MTLLEIIRKKKLATATAATPATHNPQNISTVATVASVAVANSTSRDIQIIKIWLYSICELEEDHYLVLDKCTNDPEAMAYFLKHARGEFDHA